MSEASEANVRQAAFERLLRIESEGAFIGLDSDDVEVGGRARRQAMEYVAGITRFKRRLDFLLARFYNGPYADMEVGLKLILRIGLYDLLYLHTPTYAAVNEAVALAKRNIRTGAGGLVNGILRSVDRAGDDLPQPDSGDRADDLAVTHSHPTWMVRRWLRRYGDEQTEAFLRWNNARPAFGIRVNVLADSLERILERLSAAGVEWTASEALPYFVRVASVQPLLEAHAFDEGLCAVQDESAGLVVALLDPQPGQMVVDLCAAPGGKAAHAAQRMNNRGRIEAVDAHQGRLRLVRRAAESQGIKIIHARHADARSFDGEWEGRADAVLVDAPCSGFGVLAKRADLRWRSSPEKLAELATLQSQILDAAAQLVRPGGILVYSTCTTEPEENEDRVVDFLNRHPQFTVEGAASFVPERFTTPEGYYATFPPRDAMDGAFGVRMRRAT